MKYNMISRKKQLYELVNVLRLELNSMTVDNLRGKIHLALEEEYERGVDDGKIIQEHGSLNWIE